MTPARQVAEAIVASSALQSAFRDLHALPDGDPGIPAAQQAVDDARDRDRAAYRAALMAAMTPDELRADADRMEGEAVRAEAEADSLRDRADGLRRRAADYRDEADSR